MITTTNPPEDESEPEPERGWTDMGEARPETPPNPEAHPESLRRHDRYVDDKFLEIFKHEDRNGALSRIFEEGLSQNDNGSQWAPITSWRDWWQRAKRAENQQGGN